MQDKEIVNVLKQTQELIEKKQEKQGLDLLNEVIGLHPEWVDQRLLFELDLLNKELQYRKILRNCAQQISLETAYEELQEKYEKSGEIKDDFLEVDELPRKDTVWWCWLQGINEIPDVIKRCLESLKKTDLQLSLLDETNLKDYISLPEWIEEKYKKGIIGKAHYSDLVRLELLTTWGGIWIDATAFFSGQEDLDQIMQEDLFVFRSGNVSPFILFDNWLIRARKRSKILLATKNMLFDYWKRENEAKHYFIFHLFFTMACHLYPDEYEKIPLYSNEPSHILQYSLEKLFSNKRWMQIQRATDIHKLTYKRDRKEIRQGSFMEQLLQDKL